MTIAVLEILWIHVGIPYINTEFMYEKSFHLDFGKGSLKFHYDGSRLEYHYIFGFRYEGLDIIK